ncbi:GUN4 domain-containing protein [Desmonostoc muscorum LEGE 12446]|uniref:GUN4 domain-containing protein n=1 Tax=Desmonostoc muscorum LEGE 12446 TaxID=1828758 RepID=A0A8J7AIZ7_DESMC|nr:GUN4 domain-containing protein [Desmonostoc muscorum]MCF2151492.1 GUN4 domain-containing protein [Desmonostoc muscorum LEGE 12446]
MTVKILHISLTEQGKDYALLRYFWDDPSSSKEHKLSLAEIKELIDRANTLYFTRRPVDYDTTGQALYHWLDKSDRLLANALNQPHPQGLIIALSTDKGLAHLPWELLHDGECFLVEKRPSIIPVRWVSNGKPIMMSVDTPQNRPLNVLFMATSPLGVEPVLDYEAEEGQILKATERTPMDLRVEESGCLTELAYMVREYETSYFDVFHLTGHASAQDKKPCFLTEDEYGNRVDSSTSAIADALRDNSECLPPLIFLSGCRTGYSWDNDNTVPSMAEELLNIGATAVLGWGDQVRDADATSAASKLYWELSQGGTVAKAIASTYQKLIEQKVPDWHKLRLYVASTLPLALVTPLKTSRRKQLPKSSNEVEFRDDEKLLRVVSRENFVGRRRQLQNCLRTLKTEFNKVGVLIHGMGGWGKSSIASRLWDRLPEHEKILWWRSIHEFDLIKKLKNKLIKPLQLELITHLENSQILLKSRLVYLFRELADMGEKPFLLIFDDFEWNLELREGLYILKPQAAPILEALVQAIQETGTDNRIIITCRYDFDSDLLEFFYKQGLEPLKNTELTKKLSQLENFSSNKVSDPLRERALAFADGNPRLLEFLNNEILDKQDAEEKLIELERSPALWKDKIISEELYQLIHEPLQRVLCNCLVYELPVPMIALEAVCDQLTNYQQQLQRGLKLGLIEVSSEVQEENRVYRVSHIPHIIPNIHLPEAPKVYSLYQKAHEKLYELWRNENKKVEKWQEIFRLKFANKDSPGRFRQGFFQMLVAPNDGTADEALESELRKVADDLVKDGLYTQLSNYLQQKQWFEADVETAWIFYQFKIRQKNVWWLDFLNIFPCKTLREIDRLWLQNSNNKFGISTQMEIRDNLVQNLIRTNEDDWRYPLLGREEFIERVGWNVFEYKAVIDNVLSGAPAVSEGSLPLMILCKSGASWGFGWLVMEGHVAYIQMMAIGQRLRECYEIEDCSSGH